MTMVVIETMAYRIIRHGELASVAYMLVLKYPGFNSAKNILLIFVNSYRIFHLMICIKNMDQFSFSDDCR
jgi:hypothetical protein